ncbi:MAG: L-threonylcarbamoyladenylate synthase [Bacteroidales bacterium]|jgi:L-threonylcarbamoyladenylate synthase|nr:L-threonylcarbamoyladenylate synthase [Bacteroidales bacterium]
MNYEDDLKNSLEALRKGGIILYPTDTVWGLGCDATNHSAVEKIFTVKSRSESKSLIILVDSEGMLERYVKDIPPIVYEITAVSDSPITIIYPEGKNLAPGVCSEDGSVGIRVCREEFCSELIRRFRKPLISTSANISGKPLPAHFGEIDEDITRSADYVVKYRQKDRQKHSASPVIKVEKNGVFKIIRI